MKKILLLITAIAFTSVTIAQQDAKAKGILDRLSVKTKSYTSIKAKFEFTIKNKAEGINETQTGSIIIKGDKYFLSIKGQDVISDGKTVWTHLKESEEVQINDAVSDDEEEDFISPTKIFTLYESGFKYQFLKEADGIQIINLFPLDVKEKSYHRISLFINKAKNQVVKINVHQKDGGLSTYKILTFIPNTAIPASKFTFDKSKYPNIEVIDLRD